MGKIILRLDRVMADRKMSLNELSEKVGVTNVNLSKIKTGKISAVRFSTLEAICEPKQLLPCHRGNQPRQRGGGLWRCVPAAGPRLKWRKRI